MKQKFIESSFDKLKLALENISDTETSDIYAISFLYQNEDDDPRFPTITVSYNTNENFKESIQYASDESEARWNYAYWLQNEIESVGGKNDDLLNSWFLQTPYFYSDEDDEHASNDESLFNMIMAKGSKFNDEFIDIVINLTKRLFSEKVILRKFGKEIPILVHELEIYDKPISWTLRSNPVGLIDEYLEWTNSFE